MPIVRKILSILFAGLILFNIFGYYVVFKCDQIRVRTEVQAMIRNGSLRGVYEEITIPYPATNRDFTMLDKGEFRFRGKLYDVVSVRFSGTSMIFKCINDTREEQLLARYEKYSTWVAGMNLPEKSRNSQAMLYHIIKHALLNNYSIEAPASSSVVLFFEPARDFNSRNLEPTFPPPKVS
jgi:hypothetical protein